MIWDEVNTMPSMISKKRYFSNGDSLRLYEFVGEGTHRFKVISRLNNNLREFPKLTEELANKYCEIILEEEKEAVKRSVREISDDLKASTYARYIIHFCNKKKLVITNIVMQKLLYAIQKEWIKRTGKKLFLDNIEAWKFGPCISSIYYSYCCYGAMPIFELDEESYIKPSYISGELKEMLDELATEYTVTEGWNIAPFKAWKRVLDEIGVYGVICKEMIKWEIENEDN